jgi:RNA recognition motif-containing protein
MNIYIGNLSLETTEAELRRAFEKYGSVLSVTILNDEYIGSGQQRGYAYVQMEEKADGKEAIEMLQGTTLREHTITIVEALPLTRKTTVSPQDRFAHNPRGISRSHRYF